MANTAGERIEGHEANRVGNNQTFALHKVLPSSVTEKAKIKCATAETNDDNNKKAGRGTPPLELLQQAKHLGRSHLRASSEAIPVQTRDAPGKIQTHNKSKQMLVWMCDNEQVSRVQKKTSNKQSNSKANKQMSWEIQPWAAENNARLAEVKPGSKPSASVI